MDKKKTDDIQRKRKELSLIGITLFITFFLMFSSTTIGTELSSISTHEITQVFLPRNDTSINQKRPYETYSNSTNLYVSNTYGNNSSGWEQDTLLRFDLSELPLYTQVHIATLYLYYYDYKNMNPVHRVISLHQLTSEWNPNTVNWKTRPTHTNKNVSFTSTPSTFGWMTWNVTSETQRIISNPSRNFGWQLSDDTPWRHINIPIIVLKSTETQTICQPYLKIAYTIPLIVTTSGPYEAYVNENISMNSSFLDGGTSPYKWHWDFGDGATASSQNTTHTYRATGYYTISLTVSDVNGQTATTTTSATIREMTNEPSISIRQPQNGLYLWNKKIISLHKAWVIGPLDILVDTQSRNHITKVKFLLDNQIQAIDTTAPYTWTWDQKTSAGRHIIKVIVVDINEASAVDQITVWKIF